MGKSRRYKKNEEDWKPREKKVPAPKKREKKQAIQAAVQDHETTRYCTESYVNTHICDDCGSCHMLNCDDYEQFNFNDSI